MRCKNDGFHFRASGPRNLSSFCPGGGGGGKCAGSRRKLQVSPHAEKSERCDRRGGAGSLTPHKIEALPIT